MDLEKFIKKIDKNSTLDIKKVLKDISLVAITNAIVKTVPLLTEDSQKLLKATNNLPEPNIGQIIAIFEKEGKLVELNKNIVILSEYFRNDYIKFQYNNAPKETQLELDSAFPELKSILKQ